MVKNRILTVWLFGHILQQLHVEIISLFLEVLFHVLTSPAFLDDFENETVFERFHNESILVNKGGGIIPPITILIYVSILGYTNINKDSYPQVIHIYPSLNSPVITENSSILSIRHFELNDGIFESLHMKMGISRLNSSSTPISIV